MTQRPAAAEPGPTHNIVSCLGVSSWSSVLCQRRLLTAWPLSACAGWQGEGAQEALQKAVGDQEFFCALLPGGRRLVHVIERGVRHPLSFGRDMAAALAGAPDRADWKACQVGNQAPQPPLWRLWLLHFPE